MRIRCRANETNCGVFIDRIETKEDAISLRNFFREVGQKPIGPPVDRQILLFGLSMEQFAMLVQEANIEFV